MEKQSEIQSHSGRRPANQSRGAELRAGLASWMRIPEDKRISLRGLAKQLGTSHQLLNSFLRGWDRWQVKEYRRQAKEIHVRAEAQRRGLTPWEEQRVNFCTSQALKWTFSALLNDEYEKMRRQAKRGKLSAVDVKVLTYFGGRGERRAQEILEMSRPAPKGRKIMERPKLCKRDKELLEKLNWVGDSDEGRRLINQLTAKGKAAFNAAREERRKRTGSLAQA